MTLGPDRITRLRWLGRMPMYSPDDDSGAGNTDGNTDGNDDGSKDGKGKADTDTDAGKQSGKNGKALTREIDGVVYVIQDHVNKLVGDARNEGKTTGKTEFEQELKTKELQDQQQYKPLFEAEKTKREALEKEIADAALKTLKLTIGAKHGLSATLAARLTGDKEADIEADAKAVAKELGKDRKIVDTEGGNGSRVRQQGNNGTNSNTDDTGKKKARKFAFQSDNDVSWNRES